MNPGSEALQCQLFNPRPAYSVVNTQGRVLQRLHKHGGGIRTSKKDRLSWLIGALFRMVYGCLPPTGVALLACEMAVELEVSAASNPRTLLRMAMISRGGVRWGGVQRIHSWGGHIDIVALSPLYRRFSRALGRRYIDDIIIADTSTIFELNVTFVFINISHGECPGARQAHALRAAMHSAVCTSKLNKPDPMQHRESLRDHSSWPRQGPWGARGRLPVTKCWP